MNTDKKAAPLSHRERVGVRGKFTATFLPFTPIDSSTFRDFC
jgi:hypothetical protein